MKKSLMFAAVMAMGMAAVAAPTYIYFQVNQDLEGYQDFTFDYVTVRTADTGLKMDGGDYYRLYANDDQLTTLAAYAGTFDSTYSGKLTFELWLTDDSSSPFASATYAFSDWSAHSYADMQQTGATPLTVSAVPEPTSGILLLMGLAGLALRRRKHLRAKGASLLVFAFAASFVFGAANDTMITFSTKGPDAYADGVTVKDGECYALVWTRTGTAFAGIAADGHAVDSANANVLLVAPVAKGGRCPTVVFEVDAKLAATLTGGSYGVYLLDTRLANGRVGGVKANGEPVAVNGWGSASGSAGTSSGSSGIGSLTGGAQVAVTTKSAAPANAPQPQITAMKIVGGNVYLTVKNTLPCLQYAASEFKELGATPQVSQTPVQGAATTDAEITIVAPMKGTSGFYRVSRP